MFDGYDLTREREFVVRLARVDDDAENDSRVQELLKAPLDWNWIVVTATRHKVVQLLWHNMTRKSLIGAALGTGGLPELWTVHLDQMYAAGRERNKLWLANAADVSQRLSDVGLRVVALKGGALIGDVYAADNRFLNDIDFLAKRADADKVKERMFEIGYRYGSYNYATGQIDGIDRRVERAWLFNNHVMPNFYRLSGSPWVPYYKIQIGFDFFDPFEEFGISGEAVVDDAVPKPDGSPLLVPTKIDTLINLCCHIYREGVSLVYEDYNVNWQLGKFCDVLGFLLKYDAEISMPDFLRKVAAEGIQDPVYYGLHYTNEVFRHPVLDRWLAATAPENLAYLDELRDGERRFTATEPFQERLFSLRRVRAEPRAGWNRQFRRNEW
ncbi:nucleotidyltransferase family protein [Microbispora cellulosiformans]|uniref:Nucleotidyltransferase family protein n=1 Tax=Microbispora cellulosiformans TaxID=2614688 RepID=A0A5J5K9B1_9ACTN|nr:nucleotidyltransferase family protein [Microbispora cellulosiformans]KAA9381407.1 nucleotidyltransferase family protein [Microbispora cellulosiformans]